MNDEILPIEPIPIEPIDDRPIDFDFSLEHMPNCFGMHDNGTIKIFLSSFNFGIEEINVKKIIEFINHETYHFCMHQCLTEEELKTANQERIIGKIMLKTRE